MSAKHEYINFTKTPGARFEYEALYRGMNVGNIEDLMMLVSPEEFIEELKKYNDNPDNSYLTGVNKTGVAISGLPEVTKIYAVMSFPQVMKKLNILYLKYIEDKE
jgi:hypothetical protein